MTGVMLERIDFSKSSGCNCVNCVGWREAADALDAKDSEIAEQALEVKKLQYDWSAVAAERDQARADAATARAALAGSSCCQEDGEGCGPFYDVCEERDQAKAALADALEAFLNMVADGELTVDCDGDEQDGRLIRCTRYRIEGDLSGLQDFCDALGIQRSSAEPIEDAIARAVETDALDNDAAPCPRCDAPRGRDRPDGCRDANCPALGEDA